MKRFVLSGLSVLLAAAAIVPAVEAKTPNTNSLGNTTLQQRRLEALDQRTKGNDDSLVDTTIQQRRLHELNQRTKSSDSLRGSTIQQYRLDAIDARDKA
ncbi:MAG: hypothetical protein AAGF93_00730 [Cyanobacteria bacterium P01_H01_bin.105]